MVKHIHDDCTQHAKIQKAIDDMENSLKYVKKTCIGVLISVVILLGTSWATYTKDDSNKIAAAVVQVLEAKGANPDESK